MSNEIDWNGVDEEFMFDVWGALKADATDLRKQQRILKAFRNATSNRTEKPANSPSPELVERMVAYCRIRAFDGSREAKEIMDELEPVDPDLALARACLDAADTSEGAILMAIKRVRAEK